MTLRRSAGSGSIATAAFAAWAVAASSIAPLVSAGAASAGGKLGHNSVEGGLLRGRSIRAGLRPIELGLGEGRPEEEEEDLLDNSNEERDDSSDSVGLLSARDARGSEHELDRGLVTDVEDDHGRQQQQQQEPEQEPEQEQEQEQERPLFQQPLADSASTHMFAAMPDPKHGPAIFGWNLHHAFGCVLFLAFGAFICSGIPVLNKEYDFYKEKIGDDEEPFSAYLEYRFTDWFTMNTYAPSFVLLFLTLGLIVTGALLYALLVGSSPAYALWRIFVWSTGSPAEREVSPGGRFLGTVVTICGLIILSLLLGIVTEVFSSHMREIKQGQSKVVEGGHVVILGYTECTRCFLEELANAKESEGGGMFCILAQETKEEVESYLFGNDLAIRNSRIVVRSGNSCVIRDLHKVAANSAGQVVILSDTSVSQEEADAKSIRTLLALKTKGWPSHGRIVVQCASEDNRALFKNLYKNKDVEVVVVGNIVARLMAQSSVQPGLASVFGMMLGFEGDEFYAEEWKELVGVSFREAVFRIRDAVPLGVFTADGQCNLNPGWNYEIKCGDQIIVLAEDNDKYEPADEVYYPIHLSTEQSLREDSPIRKCLQSRKPKEITPSKILIIGWNVNISPLLLSLDGTAGDGSSVVIYSPRSIQEREAEILKLEQQLGGRFKALSISHLSVEAAMLTSRLELERLKAHEHDSIFILAEGATRARADERTMAALAQLADMHEKIPAQERRMHTFNPVVEMCEDSTAEHLKVCGFTNFVHSNSLVSQALAAVTEEPKVNAIYLELMAHCSNTFEFRAFGDFLDEGEEEPEELSFGEAAFRISKAGDISLVAWSITDEEGNREWKMNPKDKVTKRRWTPEDRVVVIRRCF